MANIPFFKYEGTGNDFVLIDNRRIPWLTRSDTDHIRTMCDRRFGIGADGLILLQDKEGFDFEMVYFNADGRESTMCGNGGRCIAAFARHLNLVDKSCRFLAVDGEHEAHLKSENFVELKMSNVVSVEAGEGYFMLDTGSPHYIIFVEDLDDIDVMESGQVIRYSDRFREAGINVNFVEKISKGILVATYERGVENETLSCGTGVTASALATYLLEAMEGAAEIAVRTKGGELKVRFRPDGKGGFTDIWLCGPARLVFEGIWFTK